MVRLCLHQGFSICTFLEGLNFSALSCLKPFSEGNVGKILFSIIDCICVFTIKAQEGGKSRISLFVLLCIQTCHFIIAKYQKYL